MKNIIVIMMLLVVTPNLTNVYGDNTPMQTFKTIDAVFRNNFIELESKSIKGWLRIFHSKEKTFKYGIVISDYERVIVLKELKEYSKERKKRLTMGIK